MKRTAIIMAGGSGERFWPLSRKRKPKQLLTLINEEKTLIEDAIERIADLIPAEDVFIITSEVLVEPMRDSLKNIPPGNIVPEPYKRNTAPCLALGAAYIAAKYSDLEKDQISIAVLTADQNIHPQSAFTATVASAMDYCEEHSTLLTIGIPPERPETGYGYIETESKFGNSDKAEILPVKSFREKPDYETACKFVESGRFLWNSGMFFWRMDTFEFEMISNAPEVGTKIDEMTEALANFVNKPNETLVDAIGPIFSEMPNISIDYALMEKSDKVAVAKALFNWDDVGSWDALERVRENDANGNITQGNVSLVDTTNSIIMNNSKDRIITACLGVDNLVVIVTDDSVMICPKDRVQEIKKNVEHIRENYGEKWL